MSFLAQFISLLVWVLTWAIILRAIISWFRLAPDNPIIIILNQVTEPVIAPLRRIVPSVGMMDITPMVAIILINVLGSIVERGLSGIG